MYNNSHPAKAIPTASSEQLFQDEIYIPTLPDTYNILNK